MDIALAKLHEKANDAALVGDFILAIKLNQDIIRETPGDSDAYLRLGFAYLQTGDFISSKQAYRQALKIEPMNQIARNNLDKIKILEKDTDNTSLLASEGPVHSVNPNLFLNVLGKTKEVTLVNIGQADVLAKLKIGELVEFKIKKRRVEVRDTNNEYIGALPDDISKRLIFFLEADSSFLVYIKAASKNYVDIFIKEEKKGAKVRGFATFPKNIQDDLKMMNADTNENEDSPEAREGQEDTDGTVNVDEEEMAPETDIDLEALADRDDEEFHGAERSDFEDEDE
ncbi:hypothetical protein A3D80_02150 [Candidatus Roizmanbacteria bacterium RIFCSPHIGHO2_02_FULL_40_13b]|uniref:Uncharacterized protein n=1 Tax=Candidatus Roizmanbacteria bacterium RIFCSPHIGHO2_01_FULL_39_24 TaxID=1802032 RepID=A0A1F7GGP5_9BACT|nr:MAG: hypothetical protein A2799_04685 [Candidatus Roizmanbacteria bacterium RIFCSPHIGHO2_01_FULL_39_24]OGK26636.1 MAG: hypothetical protein A3D80_02150 [Candidatus Roizmanbacteria bacterium RIFCSPHIGHO2_02_FULL_40_13b]OGK48941.1 MAG: hypothetical protein A3A56_02555 [Candidatus Roizmanbacteria bacterium RIFCSPLOWO2_01_FULL_40_32]OGK56063.1 MAG: hypothetical protein A3H83_03775 [Candidatus Roizmanbacteria bacterium RIFCSPLOWO2_02_FULL_39_8]